MNEHQPYFYTGDGICPPWFEGNVFTPKKYDASFPFKPRGKIYTLSSNPTKEIENPFDLRNLRIIDPQEVLRALQELEDANKNPQTANRPTICVIATGGTIASAMSKEKQTEGEVVASVDIQTIFEFVGRFYKTKYNYSAFSFNPLIDSSQMKLDYYSDMVISMSYIWMKMSTGLRRNFRGFMITHGTDTYSPSLTRIANLVGANLDFSIGGVCAQETMESSFTDVSDNVGRAVATLERLFEVGRKTVFGYAGGSAGGAYTPSGMIKISDADVRAFDSPAMDLIIDASNVQRARAINLPFFDAYSQIRHPQLDHFQPLIIRGTINSRIIEAQMDIPDGEYTRIIQAFAPDVTAVIVKTYGSFTFDESQVDDIVKGTRERNMLLFATNPFPTGSIEHRYSAALHLLRQGAIPLHMLPHAAVVKLLYGEGIFSQDKDLIEAFMTSNNFVGEQPKIWTHRPLKEGISILPMGQPRESIPDTELEVYP